MECEQKCGVPMLTVAVEPQTNSQFGNSHATTINTNTTTTTTMNPTSMHQSDINDNNNSSDQSSKMLKASEYQGINRFQHQPIRQCEEDAGNAPSMASHRYTIDHNGMHPPSAIGTVESSSGNNNSSTMNWSTANNGVMRNNAIIVTNDSAMPTIVHSTESSKLGQNSYLTVVPSPMAVRCAATFKGNAEGAPSFLGNAECAAFVVPATEHDDKGSQPMIVQSHYSQNNRFTSNNLIDPQSSSQLSLNEKDSCAMQSQHQQHQYMRAMQTHHNSPRSQQPANEQPPIKYGVQSSIIRMAGPASSSASDDAVDLSEWLNSRVLALQEDIYVAGIIRSVNQENAVLVEFDYPEGTQQMYYDCLGGGRYDVISDASPSVGDIVRNARVVCMRPQTNRPGNVFIEGIIEQILNDTKQIVVRTTANGEVKTVKRGQIRLLRPPWWDELNDSTGGNNPGLTAVIATNAKPMHVDSSIYSNSLTVGVMPSNNLTVNNGSRGTSINRKYVTRTEQGPQALQLHHVLPTLQPTEEYYRTAATSPFPLTSNSITDAVSDVNTVLHQSNSNQIPEIIVSQQPPNPTILSSTPSAQAPNDPDLRRSHHRSYDDFDSDDELKREDISFNNDGEFFLLILLSA